MNRLQGLTKQILKVSSTRAFDDPFVEIARFHSPLPPEARTQYPAPATVFVRGLHVWLSVSTHRASFRSSYQGLGTEHTPQALWP